MHVGGVRGGVWSGYRDIYNCKALKARGSFRINSNQLSHACSVQLKEVTVCAMQCYDLFAQSKELSMEMGFVLHTYYILAWQIL